MTADTLQARRSASPCSLRMPFALAVFCLGWMTFTTAAAQEADTVRTPSPPGDSLTAAESAPAAMPARRVPMPPVGFEAGTYGAAIVDTLPARLGVLDLSELLGDVPGAFLYRFAMPGWPDGWSPYGLPPHRSMLSLDDAPFTHIFTGRPGFDIAPLAFIEPPRLAPQRFDRPAAVSMRTRPFATARPLTEMKYWKGGDGLESIDVVHAQRRQMSLFGAPGFMNLMGSYSGHGADGEYPGTDLHRGRQVQVRLRYAQPRWSAELHELHTRRSVGAHGGVIPDDRGFESIYERLAAGVENPAARRRLVRNDLAATARLHLFGSATTLGAFWTAETFRYRDAADTVGTASDRFGLRMRQPLYGRMAAEVVAWTESIEPRYRFGTEPLRRTELHAAVRDTLAVSGWRAGVGAGIHGYDGAIYPGGHAEISRTSGALSFDVGASLSGEPASAVEHMGFLALGASSSDRSGRVAEAFAQVGWRGGPFDVSIRGFGNRTSDPRDVYMVTDYQATPDSAAVLVASEPMVRAGAALDVGWRRDAERGFYALLQPSAVELLNDDASDLHARMSHALPTLFGRARLGARYALFKGDLDLDVFAEAHFWSRTTGRALHPETGLLAVPIAGAISFGSSSMINLGAEAGVRDATIFVNYENVLSGTEIITGNLIVPIYPLPAQRFRFGVHWPIFD